MKHLSHLSFALPLLLSLSLSLSLSTACFPEQEVPIAAKLDCKSNANCPIDWVCLDTSGICVNAGELDRSPPSAEVKLEPKEGNAETIFVIDIDASEPLLSAEVFFTDGQENHRLFQADANPEHAEQLRFTYQPNADDDNPDTAGVFPVTAILTDRAGNPSAIAVGTLTLDFAAPRLAGVEVDPMYANAGTPITLVLTFDEALLTDEESVAARETDAPSDRGLAITGFGNHAFDYDKRVGTTYHFTYTPDGSEDEQLYTLSLATEDFANNRGEHPNVHDVVLDLTPPAKIDETIQPGPGPGIAIRTVLRCAICVI